MDHCLSTTCPLLNLKNFTTNYKFHNSDIESSMAFTCINPARLISFPVTKISPKRAKIRAQKSDNNGKEDDNNVVIIGAGIAGLATAVSLQRVGIKSKVFEQGESLRTGGTSLTLAKNGWSVLDALGVGDELRSQFLEIQGLVIKSEEGRELRSFNLKDEDPSQELRGVERRTLLETLANQLPRGTISFSSKLTGIEQKEDGIAFLKLEDGSKISAKVVIACDGIRSPAAKWMGFPEAKYVGQCAIRGLGFFPQGQPLQQRVNYIYGKGIRAGFVPISSTKVYWFICFNSSSPGPKITDPSVLRQQSKELVRNWPSDLLNIIDATPDDTIIKTPLVDRWLWPVVSPPASKGNVVLAGDAWHPMTPNLGQGACCALEDAVVLAKKIAEAMQSETVSIQDAFRSYEKAQWGRVFPLTIRANAVGTLLQLDNPLICAARNNIVIPKLVRLGPMLEHTSETLEYTTRVNVIALYITHKDDTKEV